MTPGTRRRRPRSLGLLASLGSALLLAFASGCAYPIERRNWSDFEGPGARYFHAEEVVPPSFPDPVEPFNRSFGFVNDQLIHWVVRPVGWVYRLIIPHFVRERGRDFGANLLFGRNLIANVLQWRWRNAGTETLRFGINSTLGVAGLWDAAWYFWKIPAHPEDFGQVFGTWGWRPSTFVMLPLVGPSTIRDGIGLIPDTLADPATYYFPASYVLTFNQLVDSIPAYTSFVASRQDPYDDARLLWTLNRNEQIKDAPPPPHPQGDDTSAVQTLESAFTAPRDPEFGRSLRTRSVVVPSTGRNLPYSYRLQAGQAPTVFLMPGLGTHRIAAAAQALAEMSYERGFSVVILSSTFNFEFMQRASSVPLPGHAPVDSRDVHIAMDAISRDLDAREPGRIGERVYMGYSLGAFHGFFIAAEQETGSEPLVQFERFVLLDPPVRLITGLEKLDAFFNAPLVYPPEQREHEIMTILNRAIDFARNVGGQNPGRHGYDRFDATDLGDGGLEPATELPFKNIEAKFLIGLAFRRTLQTVLWVSQQRFDLGVLLTQRSELRRWAAYQEIADYSYAEYLYGFVLPYYRDHLGEISTADELVEENDLHALSKQLHDNPRLRIFANTNDFLTTNEDVAWLQQWIGPERVSMMPTGGHLGNLNRPEVQKSIMDSLQDLLPSAQPTGNETE